MNRFRAMFLPYWRKQAVRLTVLGAINLALFCAPNFPAAKQRATENQIQKSLKSVVSIYMKDSSGKLLSQGSGFFVKRDLVATNYHVIESGSSGFIKIGGEGYEYPIEGVAAFDERRDLAVIRVGGSGDPLKLQDAKPLQAGDEVYALGNPQGLEGSVSNGIVSGLRNISDYHLVQITAPISHGSSGGPILTKTGDVVAVAIGSLKSGQNLNFAVPSQYVSALLLKSASSRPLPNRELSELEKKGGVRVAADLEATRSTFFLVKKEPNGKFQLVKTNIIPNVPGQSYGWGIDLNTSRKRVTFVEEFRAPVPVPLWGITKETKISKDRMTATTIRTEDNENNRIYGGWTIAPNDPSGVYRITVSIDGSLVETFEFEVK